MHAEQHIPLVDRDIVHQRNALDRGLVVHRLFVGGCGSLGLVQNPGIDIARPEVIDSAALLRCLTHAIGAIHGEGQIVLCRTRLNLPVHAHLDIVRALRRRGRLLLQLEVACVILDDERTVAIHDVAVQLVLEEARVDEALPVLREFLLVVEDRHPAVARLVHAVERIVSRCLRHSGETGHA